jgi:hypothetical protein
MAAVAAGAAVDHGFSILLPSAGAPPPMARPHPGETMVVHHVEPYSS